MTDPTTPPVDDPDHQLQLARHRMIHNQTRLAAEIRLLLAQEPSDKGVVALLERCYDHVVSNPTMGWMTANNPPGKEEIVLGWFPTRGYDMRKRLCYLSLEGEWMEPYVWTPIEAPTHWSYLMVQPE